MEAIERNEKTHRNSNDSRCYQDWDEFRFRFWRCERDKHDLSNTLFNLFIFARER